MQFVKGCAWRSLIKRQIGVVSGDLYWASVCTGGERSSLKHRHSSPHFSLDRPSKSQPQHLQSLLFFLRQSPALLALKKMVIEGLRFLLRSFPHHQPVREG